MQRFHVHVAVNALDESVRFYSAIFGAAPTVMQPDYAKWMLEDPRINFAISVRGHPAGVNHLGFQVEDAGELEGMRTRLEAADAGLIEQCGQACCYARSDKYWITDPQGIAWETFHTLESIPVFGASPTSQPAAACCVPLAPAAAKADSACCVPTSSGSGSCCAA
jgi:catechol 2,3-dioxygenase-like lactoylglutathione lyase family enzyme